MSYDPRAAERPYGAPRENDSQRKGSVRAAREKLQAAQSQEQPSGPSRIEGLPHRPNQLVSQFSRNQQQEQQRNLTPPDSRGNGGSPTPQWPLPNDATDVIEPAPQQQLRQQIRGPPPQRPPRPISDDLPIQSTSQDDYRTSYQSDDIMSPVSAATSSRPLTTSSAASEASSLGSIPDFPVPLPPMPVVQPLPRRQPSLGPPPSARRGPPSYYTQMSYVSPIAEESSETRSDTIRSHHGSFASSNVFPTTSGDDYYGEEGVRSEDDETVTSDRRPDSRASDHDDRSELVQPALVRQASLGRRTKPSLMTIKSVDTLGSEKRTSSVKRKPTPEGTGVPAGATGIGSAVLAARDGITGRGPQAPSLGSGSVLLDPSSSSEEDEPARGEKARLEGLDPEKDDYFSHHMQQGAKQTLADRVGKRRPPRIDVDAVREAEARGSLTSLPELIRRATRLAANLDRGRTASRLGLDFWEAGGPEKGRRSGSLSDMLAAFPPPGEATPTGNRTPNAQTRSKWPAARGTEYGRTDSPTSERTQDRRRRCCGMPMWTFVTLLIVLIFLIAAAVVIPVVLIVLPKMRDSQATAPPTTTGDRDISSELPPLPAPTTSGGQSDRCEGLARCLNGGVAIPNADGSCNCVCINGFTGEACEREGDAACTTMNVSGAADNATVGSNIPRLLETAESNFSIPLDAPLLLSLFSDMGLSCTTENALVTFNGLAARSTPDVDISFEPSKSLPMLEMPDSEEDVQKLAERQAIGEPGTPRPSVTASASPTVRASATPTPSAQPISRNATAIDFARVGILLLLQETRDLEAAADAQVEMQNLLRNARDGESNDNTIDLGAFEMDLGALSVDFGNGTIIQARPADSDSA